MASVAATPPAAVPHDNVEISPVELKFQFHADKALLCPLTITNGTDSRVAYKIKTTAPKRYLVRPSAGVLDVKSHASIQVVLGAQKQFDGDLADCKDKFMVQTVLLQADEQVNDDTFNKELRKGDIREARLRVIVEGPTAPVEKAGPAPLADVPLNEDELRALDLKHLSAAEQQNKFTALNKQLAAATKDQKRMQASLALAEAERDELRKTIDQLHLQQGSLPVATDSPALRFRISIVHTILVAVLAFIIGHYTMKLMCPI